LFIDECGLGRQIAAWLVAHQQIVITVQVGTSFEQFGERGYRVHPTRRKDYEALLNQLRQQGLKPDKIVHLWSVTSSAPADLDGTSLGCVLDLGFNSLMALAQAMGELGLTSIELSIVSSQTLAVTGHEILCPEKATLIGPCRVIPSEYTSVSCRLIDVDLEAPDSWRAERVLTNLLGELTSGVADSLVALRRDQRWVEAFEPAKLSPLAEEGSAILRPNGVYLITGGLGGIGLAMAEYLARTVQAKLVLTGRSPLPPRSQWPHLSAAPGDEAGLSRKIQGVERLEELGAEVLLVAADVTSETQMREAVEQAIARFGAIHGLLHTAGVPGAGLMQFKTPEAAADVLAPKVIGTRVLERVLQSAEVELDFLILFSSTASIVGGLGQIDYCAANAFLDVYAQSCAPKKRLTTSINWGDFRWNAWEEALAGYSPEVRDFFLQNRARIGITFAEGAEVLARILSHRFPQFVVSSQSFEAVVALSKRFTIESVLAVGRERDSGAKHTRPALDTTYVAPSNDLECKIAAVWSDVLGIAEIGIDDNFFDLGGDSLIGLELIAHLKKVVEQEMPAHILYEAPSVGKLAEFINGSQQKEALITAEKARGAKRRQRAKRRKQALPTGE
jgi:NAD(P)-dependent dehydrogenase (short-subunit alcohol dehydrogenase family)/acyl carrier protein